MGFLEEVAALKRIEVAKRKEKVPLITLQRLARRERSEKADGKENHISFSASLRQPGISLIAEIKRASPSRGLLAGNIDAGRMALCYYKAGARAISVLTEERFFGGSLDDLRCVRQCVTLPLLRKDFIIDPYQVWEAAANGADAVLLMVRMLGPVLRDLLEVCCEAGIEALVEVHDVSEVTTAVEAGAEIIGVNCRDLDALVLRPEKHLEARAFLPPGILTVAESGIKDAPTVRRLAEAGYDGVLVGEILVTAPDPGAKIAELIRGQ